MENNFHFHCSVPQWNRAMEALSDLAWRQPHMSKKRRKKRMRPAPQIKYLPLKRCTAELKCFRLLSVLFLTWHRGTCFPLCCPAYAISEREVITQGWGGMFFILSYLPASLLEIRLLSGRFKNSACWGRPVWHRPKKNATEGTVKLWSLPFHHVCN